MTSRFEPLKCIHELLLIHLLDFRILGKSLIWMKYKCSIILYNMIYVSKVRFYHKVKWIKMNLLES